MTSAYGIDIGGDVRFWAQMRSADRARKCLLFGVDRTYRGYHETDAIDPTADIRMRSPIYLW